MNDLDRVANAWEAQLGRRERARAGWLAGIRPEPELARLAAREPMLAEPEAFLAARESLGSALPDRQPPLRRLAAGLLEWLAFTRSARAEERIAAALSNAVVRLDVEALALPDAELELRACLATDRRRALSRAIAQARAAVEPLEAERLERRGEAFAQLGVAADGAWGALHGVDVAALTAAAESLLKASEGPYLEALDYRLRRERLDARAGDASRAEVELTLELPALREHLAPGQLGMVLGSVAGSLGLDVRGEGRIALDVEGRGGRFLGAQVARFAVPGEIAILATPVGTPADLDRLASAQGQAWHWAGIDRDLPIAERVAPDAALILGSGALLASILESPSWHRRVLRLPSRSSDEMARAFALRHLATLREAAARFLVGSDLRGRGAAEGLRDAYRSRLTSALGGDWGGLGWLEVDPAESAAELRGLGLGAQLTGEMPSRFDEDWWRNPHAGEFLRDRWSRGGDLACEPPDFDVAWRGLAERAVG